MCSSDLLGLLPSWYYMLWRVGRAVSFFAHCLLALCSLRSLNVLSTVVRKPLEQIFSEFTGGGPAEQVTQPLSLHWFHFSGVAL